MSVSVCAHRDTFFFIVFFFFLHIFAHRLKFSSIETEMTEQKEGTRLSLSLSVSRYVYQGCRTE